MSMRTCARCGDEFEICPTLTHCPNCHNSSFVTLQDVISPVDDLGSEDPKAAKVERYADLHTIAKINRERELTIQEPGSTTRWITSDLWVPLADAHE